MNPAPNLVLTGPMGAGKTAIGKLLAARLGLAFVDVDERVELIAGASVPALFEREGEAGFRARESQLISALMRGQGQLVATGGGAVLSAANRAALCERGFVVHLRVDIDQQLARLERDRSRPLLAGADRRATLEALAALRNPLYAECADLVVDTGDLAAGAAAERLQALVQAHWRREAAA